MTNRICWIATPDGPICVPLLARVRVDLKDGGPLVTVCVHKSNDSRVFVPVVTHEASGFRMGHLRSNATYLPNSGVKPPNYKTRTELFFDDLLASKGAARIRSAFESAPALVKPAKGAASVAAGVHA